MPMRLRENYLHSCRSSRKRVTSPTYWRNQTVMTRLSFPATHAIWRSAPAKTGTHAGASPSGKAAAFDAAMRRFESCRPSQYFDPYLPTPSHTRSAACRSGRATAPPISLGPRKVKARPYAPRQSRINEAPGSRTSVVCGIEPRLAVPHANLRTADAAAADNRVASRAGSFAARKSGRE